MTTFQNIRILSLDKQNKVKRAFQSMLMSPGVHGQSTMTAVGGELFALVHRGRVNGGVWLRNWPGRPREGDIHAALSRFRFSDYQTLIAFDLLLREREKIMGLTKWRAIIASDTPWAISALTYLGFREVGRQPFPGIGDAVILEREVK